MKFCAEGAQDDNHRMVDEEYGQKSPYGESLPHPHLYHPDRLLVHGGQGSRQLDQDAWFPQSGPGHHHVRRGLNA